MWPNLLLIVKKVGKGSMSLVGGRGASRGVSGAEGRQAYNQALMLELVRTRGPLSRSELGRMGRLNLAIVSRLAERLISEGLVREIGTGPSTGGRKPTLLDLIPEARCAVGVNVGTRTISLVITDMHGTIRKRAKEPSRMALGPDALMQQVGDVVHGALADLPPDLGEVIGIGMALPAPILDPAESTFSPPSYPGWGELRIGERTEDRFGLPVLLDNDANAAAVGEHLYGAGRGVRDMFYLIAHRGIGGAALVNGALYRGTHGGAGEIGHTVVDLDGPRCGCGRYGCLEAFAGRGAIARRASRALKLAGRQSLAGCEPGEISAATVIEAGLAGDSLAQRILEETGEYLGLGIVSAVNVLDPEVVVVGGSTMRAGDLVLEAATRVVRSRALRGLAERVRIVMGELGDDGGAVGAASIVLRGLFAVPTGARTAGPAATELETTGQRRKGENHDN
jgi:predicted NBD/HSP70 family sugar kinase